MPPEMIEATIQGVEHDMERGWFRISTSRGRFDTKIAEKAQEAMALKDHSVKLFFTEGKASGNINQYTGEPFPPPRYYERAERIGPASNGSGIPQAASRGMSRDEVWRICLSVGVKAAIDTLPLMPVEERTFTHQQQIALAWGRFLFFQTAPDLGASTPETLQSPPDPEQGFRPFAGVASQQEHPGAYDEPPPHSDSDIPY